MLQIHGMHIGGVFFFNKGAHWDVENLTVRSSSAWNFQNILNTEILRTNFCLFILGVYVSYLHLSPYLFQS